MTKTASTILNNPFLNKGTAFTKEERQALGLTGTLPSKVQTIDEQATQAYAQFKSKPSRLEQRIFLMNLFNENRTLFFHLMDEHVVEFMPIVYDPVVADSIEQYNELFLDPQNAAFVSVDAPEDIEATLKNAADGRDIRLVVVTDAEGILGMGDWGVNGVDIAIGKLMVYTAAAGIDPSQVLPVSIDAGTNNQKLLDDPLYLGNRHKRVSGAQYYDVIDKFVEAEQKLFPDSLLHFEDFGRDNAQVILDKYKDQIATFNDDIQGTGMVVLAGILGALNISKESIKDQKILSFGAGTAGMGIANQILDELMQAGLTEEEAKQHFYAVDKQGLLFDDTEGLTPAQKAFTRKRSEFSNADELTNLEAVVKAVHPTVMIGTSTQPGTFTESIVKEMAAHTERPIIFPLSNPTKLAEAKAEDLIKWTDGRALVATGIPADDVEYKGVTYQIGQGNNALMYPGLGFGLIASTAKVLNSETLSAACHALGGIVDTSKPGAAVLPPVSKITEFSQTLAEVVAQSVIDQKLNKEPITDAKQAVADMKWVPEYKTISK
ncbi:MULTISPECIES: malolactic enzyme [Lactiplantibacillus]|jgi:malate dehydrogenase (oxaloacetate-decarboxylating)|uniref:Malolactic enzyme n=1 Tax=Lactiplantibacillus pentosus TaxID=1589 RepID=A0ABD7IRB7_LACPE|nr:MULTISPECIES: malolactic enzyme [Lactiplantibacillus]ASG78927.1 NAD-dependent malic enzyme [Lactiplantibacillus pentosus]AUI79300.1 NAD-dependent malic enzyme [Lactiplantibacillus pentosus]AYG36833.1 NAD-dependent malic enzyme [Lactiplantibacillus pentosus]AYG42462.1 NAD-dependent malic enzyme [Lactiplantibacillus pentosus]MBO9163944.1 NAD-dependent malic enzyme [Lactiplantibacillus pentosus]